MSCWMPPIFCAYPLCSSNFLSIDFSRSSSFASLAASSIRLLLFCCHCEMICTMMAETAPIKAANTVGFIVFTTLIVQCHGTAGNNIHCNSGVIVADTICVVNQIVPWLKA